MKKRNIKLIIYVITILLIGFGYTAAQPVSSAEYKFNELKVSFKKEFTVLDSLKHLHSLKISEIETAKKNKTDESSIKRLMGTAITISDKIDDHQKRISSVEKELEDIKRILNKKYTTEIDSISALESSSKYEGNKAELKNQLIILTEKRISTAPKINSLSFNPEKILEINTAAANSPEEKKIYLEYLTNALSEVNNQLIQIKRISSEVKQVITLQQKAKKFLEESEFDFNIRAAGVNSQNESKPSFENSSIAADKSSYPNFQFQSFFILLNQLDLKQTTDLTTRNRFSKEIANKQLTMKEYRDLLKEIEKRLNDYRLILTSKVSQ